MDLDELGIAKTAREEKQRARNAKLQMTPEDERMAKLYRQHILQEPGVVEEQKSLVQIQV
jgi:hypothetical protein